MRSDSLDSCLRTAVSAVHDAVLLRMSSNILQSDALMMQDGISLFLHNAGNEKTNSADSFSSCRSPSQTDPFQSCRSFRSARTGICSHLREHNESNVDSYIPNTGDKGESLDVIADNLGGNSHSTMLAETIFHRSRRLIALDRT